MAESHYAAFIPQVNAAVDNIASLAEANARLVTAARGNGRAVPAAERKHAQTLLHCVSVTSWRYCIG